MVDIHVFESKLKQFFMKNGYDELYAYICQYINLNNFENIFTENIIRQECNRNGFDNYIDYLCFLKRDISGLNFLESCFSVSYSKFYRNRFTYEVLRLVILSHFSNEYYQYNEVRIWSAGCVKGEEPYSIAILYNEINQHRAEKLRFRIFATDKDEEVINNASKEGYIYSKNNISNLTVLELERYFETDGVNYKIKSQLKENISFEKHNILDNNSKCPCESIYGGFQIIICSNVLIYYNAQVQARVLKMFRSCISTDGYLICDDSEREILIQNGFIEVYPHSCIFKKI